MTTTDNIFALEPGNTPAFERTALETFRFQADRCAVYREYLDRIGVIPAEVTRIEQIPFLPIELFKRREVYAGSRTPEIVFTSSHTGGTIPSRHFMQSLAHYEKAFLTAFRTFYGDPAGWSLYGLLPNYLQREGSSLVYMADRLIAACGSGGFYLDDYEKLLARMNELGLKEEDYGFYLDLRKYGSTRHAGFGLGFERCVMYLTGMSNIRDVIPFPRTVNNCEL